MLITRFSTTVHDAYGGIFAWPSTVRREVKKTLDSGVRTLLYYGDTDAMCNSLLGQKFAASLGLEVRFSHDFLAFTF